MPVLSVPAISERFCAFQPRHRTTAKPRLRDHARAEVSPSDSSNWRDNASTVTVRVLFWGRSCAANMPAVWAGFCYGALARISADQALVTLCGCGWSYDHFKNSIVLVPHVLLRHSPRVCLPIPRSLEQSLACQGFGFMAIVCILFFAADCNISCLPTI